MRSNQNRRSIVSACEYSLENLKNIKKSLLDVNKSHDTQQMNWAVGGLIITLSSNLMSMCNDVILTSLQDESSSARDDILEIQKQFNEFINEMIENI